MKVLKIHKTLMYTCVRSVCIHSTTTNETEIQLFISLQHSSLNLFAVSERVGSPKSERNTFTDLLLKIWSHADSFQFKGLVQHFGKCKGQTAHQICIYIYPHIQIDLGSLAWQVSDPIDEDPNARLIESLVSTKRQKGRLLNVVRFTENQLA